MTLLKALELVGSVLGFVAPFVQTHDDETYQDLCRMQRLISDRIAMAEEHARREPTK